MADLSALATEVAENGDAVASASALLTELSALLRDAENLVEPLVVLVQVDMNVHTPHPTHLSTSRH